GISKPVVTHSFLGVAQNRVSFRGLFEFFFGFVISWIPIRMILERKLTVGALDFLVGGVAGNAKHLIVVPFSVQISLILFCCDADHGWTQEAAVQQIAFAHFIDNRVLFDLVRGLS